MTKNDIAVLGIDLGNSRRSLAGFDNTWELLMPERMTREAVVTFAAGLPAHTITMEACCGAYYLGRTLEAQGRTAKLMSPEYVQAVRKRQKTDERDAEAIAEPATRPMTRLVTIKSEEQLDLQRMAGARTAARRRTI